MLFWGARGASIQMRSMFLLQSSEPLVSAQTHTHKRTDVCECGSAVTNISTFVSVGLGHKHCCCCCSCLLHYFSCYPNHHKYAGICHFYPFRLFYAINIEFGKYICKKEPFSLQIPHCHSCSRQPA